MNKHLLVAERAIPAVYNIVKSFGGIIAGGSVTDKYFGKGASDLDVYVNPTSNEQCDLLMAFIEKNKFEEYSLSSAVEEVADHNELGEFGDFDFDGYGGGRSKARNVAASYIQAVYKGYILGYPVDIIILSHSVKDHINTFDQNIKRAWYDGKYRFSTEFMQDVTNGEVSCNLYDPAGYVRAKLSADKYGLNVAAHYELSRHYCAYVKEEGRLTLLPGKIRTAARDMDLGHYDIEWVQAAQLFSGVTDSYGKPSPINKLNDLVALMSKKVQSCHPLANTSFTVNIPSTDYDKVTAMARKIEHIHGFFSFFEEPETEDQKRGVLLAEDFRQLYLMQREEFNEGKLVAHGRQVRLNKYLAKLMKKYPETAASVKIMMKIVETRSVTDTATIKFSADAYDLLRISTDQEWGSCQTWEFGRVTSHNVCVLSNLGGATLVGYVADPKGSSRMLARFLIRIGKDNKIAYESTYTGRSEYQNMSHIVVKQLEELGYTVVHKENRLSHNFKSLKMPFRPYSDLRLNVYVNKNDEYILKNTALKIKSSGLPGADYDGDRIDPDHDLPF